MNELFVLSLIISVFVLAGVLMPFIVGKGGRLQDASASDSVEDLELRLTALLRRWLRDEAALAAGEITETEWQQRQRYLTARYVDTSRRLDWLKTTSLTTIREDQERG
jgi:uncharacterized membrane protein